MAPGGVRSVCRLGILALVLGAAASFPISAVTQARTPDGALLVVWQATQGLGYALLGGGGSQFAQVPDTGEATRDAAPWLALEPLTGTPVLVWSRFDGVSQKIAYARFAGGTWSDMHFLTFGGGSHTLPLIGNSRSGSFLFFVADGRRYLYAPVELSAGRLFAAPRPLHVGMTLARTETSQTAPRRPGPEGTTDVPVVIGSCDPTKTDCSNLPRTPGSPGPRPKPEFTSQGNTDIPIIVSTQQTLWSVASRIGCPTQVMAIPDRDFGSLMLLEFDNGNAHPIGRVLVPAWAPPNFGADAAASALASLCQ